MGEKDGVLVILFFFSIIHFYSNVFDISVLVMTMSLVKKPLKKSNLRFYFSAFLV